MMKRQRMCPRFSEMSLQTWRILRDVIADLKEMRSTLSPTPGDTSSLKSTVVPKVDVWDTEKLWS